MNHPLMLLFLCLNPWLSLKANSYAIHHIFFNPISSLLVQGSLYQVSAYRTHKKAPGSRKKTRENRNLSNNLNMQSAPALSHLFHVPWNFFWYFSFVKGFKYPAGVVSTSDKYLRASGRKERNEIRRFKFTGFWDRNRRRIDVCLIYKCFRPYAIK